MAHFTKAKENGICVVGKSLQQKQKCIIDLVYIADPYIHEELKLNYIRKALGLINRYDLGVTLMIQKA